MSDVETTKCECNTCGLTWFVAWPRGGSAAAAQCPKCHPRSTLDVGAPFSLANEWHTWHGRIRSINWVTGEVTITIDAIKPNAAANDGAK